MSEWPGESRQAGPHRVFLRRQGEGPGLVCLHGFPTSGSDFAPMWSGLTRRFDVLAHDLVGLGRSEKPRGPLPVAMQADVVEALARDQGITEAHSSRGCWALESVLWSPRCPPAAPSRAT